MMWDIFQECRRKKMFKNSDCSHSFRCYLGILKKTISSWSQVHIEFLNREINQKCLKIVIFRKSFAKKNELVTQPAMACHASETKSRPTNFLPRGLKWHSRVAASIITAACWQQLLFFNAVYVFIPGMAYIFTTTTTIHFK